MNGNGIDIEVGTVTIMTIDHGGFTAEFLAQCATDKIVGVASDVSAEVAERAQAVKDQVYDTVLFYMKEMAKNERATVQNELSLNGYNVNVLEPMPEPEQAQPQPKP